MFGIPFKVTKVSTKSYQGYYWTPKNARNWPKQHNKVFFCPKGKKSLGLGRSPPQELEVGPRSGPYLLVRSNIPLCLKELPRAKPEGTLEGEGVYLTVCPESSPNTDSILF